MTELEWHEWSCVLLGGTIFLGNTTQRDKTIKSEETFLKCELNTHEYKQFVPPDGTVSLGNICQRDKTTKHENIYNMQAE